ncbi:MAG: hypothetical protein ACOC2F_04460 [Bacteroidota bacterium]
MKKIILLLSVVLFAGQLAVAQGQGKGQQKKEKADSIKESPYKLAFFYSFYTLGADRY